MYCVCVCVGLAWLCGLMARNVEKQRQEDENEREAAERIFSRENYSEKVKEKRIEKKTETMKKNERIFHLNSS